MEANLSPDIARTPAGQEAERILRSCVHCGFCTATCPTYRIMGDELDGPRGRIYLIKSLLEGKDVSTKTNTHLDRCLTCRACETTCPSGVEYGKLLDIGRFYSEPYAERSLKHRILRSNILKILPYRKRFALLLKIGRLIRPLLPGSLKERIPLKSERDSLQFKSHKRKIILLEGCVQSAIAPSINQSVIKVLDKFGISAITIDEEQCCGALSHHLNAHEQSLQFMKKNIDAIWPVIDSGAEAIISTASGCGVHIKEYGYLLREDSNYAKKAAKVSAMAFDIAEILNKERPEKLILSKSSDIVAFQSPCTLQHGQKLGGLVEDLLHQMKIELVEVKDSNICCGSAGVYSMLQENISSQLRKDKLESLMENKPVKILTANIGCLEHLRQKSPIQVMHWAEYVAELID